MFVENYFLDYLKIISIRMPKIIMNSIVRRSSSMIDLNNEISLLELSMCQKVDSSSFWKVKSYPSMIFHVNLWMVLPGRVPPTCCASNRYDIDSIGYRINGAKIIEGIDTCCWKPDLLPACLSVYQAI